MFCGSRLAVPKQREIPDGPQKSEGESKGETSRAET
jgi:hypothetical protein